MERSEEPQKLSSDKPFEKVVAKATDDEFLKMQERIFNADKRVDNRVLHVWLEILWELRHKKPIAESEFPAPFKMEAKVALEKVLVSQPELLSRKEIRPPWAGTAFEPVLRRMQVLGENEVVQEQWWTFFYCEALQIAREAKANPTDRSTLSRQATKRSRIANKCESLAVDVQEFSPSLASILRRAAMTFSQDSEALASFARQRKRRRSEPAIFRIYQFMGDVKRLTGKWHDSEISELLNLAGLHHWTPESLRKLRSRYKSHSKLT